MTFECCWMFEDTKCDLTFLAHVFLRNGWTRSFCVLPCHRNQTSCDIIACESDAQGQAFMCDTKTKMEVILWTWTQRHTSSTPRGDEDRELLSPDTVQKTTVVLISCAVFPRWRFGAMLSPTSCSLKRTVDHSGHFVSLNCFSFTVFCSWSLKLWQIGSSFVFSPRSSLSSAGYRADTCPETHPGRVCVCVCVCVSLCVCMCGFMPVLPSHPDSLLFFLFFYIFLTQLFPTASTNPMTSLLMVQQRPSCLRRL